MRSLRRRLAAISLLWQILLPTLLCVALGVALMQVWTVRHTRSLLHDRLTESLNANIGMLQAEMERLGTGFHRDGDNLSIGPALLNGRNDLVDRVVNAAGGMATIFRGDTRVATTLRNDDGSRAVGTVLAPGPARSTVLDHGETYRGSANILAKDYITIYQPLKDASGTVVGVVFVGIPTASTEAALATSEREMLLVGTLVLVTLGLTLGLLLRRVLSPLVTTTHGMHQLAAGDLAIEIPHRHRVDEVGRMAAALGVFKQHAIENDRLERAQAQERARAEQDKRRALTAMADRIESEAAHSVEAVSRETERMAVTAARLGSAAEHVGADAKSASAAADEALANTQNVASAAEELSASIREIASQVGRSNAIVARAVHTGEAAQATITALSSRVAQIGTVAELISDIAAQTNLLALNATIEAARAGEAGRGFAVVASEVKALATQTTRSTEDISRHIGEVRAATDATVQTVGQIQAAISEINEVARAIATAVDQQGTATAEIARCIDNTTAAAREVADRVASVSTETAQSGEQAVEVQQHLGELANSIVALKHTVVRITRTATAEVDRRQEARVALDLPARMNVGGSVHDVRLKNLSPHGAALTGAPAVSAGVGGSLTIDGVAAALPFTVRQAEVAADGSVLHLAFVANEATTQAIEGLLRRHARVSGTAA